MLPPPSISDEDNAGPVFDASATQDMLVGIMFGNIDKVRAAIAAGANPEFTRADNPPVLMAASRGHVGIVELLIQSGANPTSANRAGWSLLHLAAAGPDQAMFDMALAHWPENNLNIRDQARNTPMHAAASNGRLAAMQALFEKAPHAIDAQDDAGNTPLMAALAEHHLDAVRWLVDNGADTARRNAQGKCPADLAAGWPAAQAIIGEPQEPSATTAPAPAQSPDETQEKEATAANPFGLRLH